VAALYLPLAVPLHLFACDALGRTSRAEQPSQIFSFLGSLKLIWDVRFAPNSYRRRCNAANDAVVSRDTTLPPLLTLLSIITLTKHDTKHSPAIHPEAGAGASGQVWSGLKR
jgi:hypothetical protein